jgi:xanthine dehydrogenase accessory factor
MSNQLIALLDQWYPLRDDSDWVLGTVYRTEGPAYRKAGAMMLFSGDGHQLGMLSGGCLESDIHRHARRVMHSRKAVSLTYDGSDEDDISFQLGIGCGGTVHVLLQPVCRSNDYLMLDCVYQALREHRVGHFYQLIPDASCEVAARFTEKAQAAVVSIHQRARLVKEGGQTWLQTPVAPPPHLLIVGGGIDARPVAAIGHQLGWRISVWDPRPANARREYFAVADRLLDGTASQLSRYVEMEGVKAAVLMSHNIRLDAQALSALQDCDLKYVALLGPDNRRNRVVAEAAVTSAKWPLAGPAGLDIGGELPESIALSILAECQAALYNHSGQSLSGVLESGDAAIRRSAMTIKGFHNIARKVAAQVAAE